MGLKLYDETSVQAIADAIRANNGSSNTYTISEMSTAIEKIDKGGTHTETKIVTFLNTTTPFNVGDNFLSGYGVYSQDNSYALAIAVSDGVGFAARLHNGVVDGYSAACTYSNGIFTFDSAFVLNYMGNSVYSLNCLFSNGGIYKYHWSNDRTICVREGVGEVKWFFKNYNSPGEYKYPQELKRFFPPIGNTPILGPAYSTSDATEQVGWIGFYQNYIRTWSMNKGILIKGNFYGVVNATDYYTNEQHEVYTDPLDIPDINISLLEKTIIANGTYSAEDDGYVGYLNVDVNVEGGGGSSRIIDMNNVDASVQGSMKYIGCLDSISTLYSTGDAIGCSIHCTDAIDVTNADKIVFRLKTGPCYGHNNANVEQQTTERFKALVGIVSSWTGITYLVDAASSLLASKKFDYTNTVYTSTDCYLDVSSITGDVYIGIDAHGWNATLEEIRLE